MNYVNNLDTPQFIHTEVARIAGVSLATFKGWFYRENPVVTLGKTDLASPVRGSPAFYTLRRVVYLAIMARLTALGVSPKHAAFAAARFSDIGDEIRAPGHHFPNGRTVLIVLSTGECMVENVLPSDTVYKIFSDIAQFTQNPNPPGYVMLDVGEVEFRVRASVSDQFERDVFK